MCKAAISMDISSNYFSDRSSVPVNGSTDPPQHEIRSELLHLRENCFSLNPILKITFYEKMHCYLV